VGHAVKVLMRSYLEGKFLPTFDFRAVRHKGARLVTAGGKALTRTIKDLFSSSKQFLTESAVENN
jgi:hypothetical protein